MRFKKISNPVKIISFVIVLSLQFAIACAQQSPFEKKIQNYKDELQIVGKQFSKQFYPQYIKFYSMPENNFLLKIDSAREVFNDVLKKYELYLQKDYVQGQKDEIKYYFDKLLIDYPVNHAIYGGKSSSGSILRRLKVNQLSFNKSELLENTDFTNYVKAFMEYSVSMARKKVRYKGLNNQKLAILWDLLPTYFSDEKCIDYWKFYYLSNHIENDGIKDIESFYTGFLATCKDFTRSKKIMDLYKEDSIGRTGHLIKTYKTIQRKSLDLHIFLPERTSGHDRYPVMVYFHGGSWSEGKPDWFFESCKMLAKKGFVACAVEYRTYGRFGSMPFDAVMDARSAIRWLRKNAVTYNIDPSRIVASGNSAGGHLVLCAALAEDWNESTDDLTISSAPNLMLINSGVYDLTDENTSWIRKDLKDNNLVKQISPIFLTQNKLPAALILHGTKDTNVPYEGAKIFSEKINENRKATIEFDSIQGAGHFIWIDPKYTPEVSKLRKDFLNKFGYPQ